MADEERAKEEKAKEDEWEATEGWKDLEIDKKKGDEKIEEKEVKAAEKGMKGEEK